jgi:hypothetical protein
MKSSVYDHTTLVNEATGSFQYDCSGFLDYALSIALPNQLAAMKTFGGTTRPVAATFENFFASIPAGTTKSGWERVTRAVDLRAGDVVAWLEPATTGSTNTGHVMIVHGDAFLNPKRADEVIVPVVDSANSGHGSTDTRAPSGQGLGAGPVGLLIDASGNPVGYRWTGGVSTTEYQTPVTLGRPQ